MQIRTNALLNTNEVSHDEQNVNFLIVKKAQLFMLRLPLLRKNQGFSPEDTFPLAPFFPLFPFEAEFPRAVLLNLELEQEPPGALI